MRIAGLARRAISVESVESWRSDNVWNETLEQNKTKEQEERQAIKLPHNGVIYQATQLEVLKHDGFSHSYPLPPRLDTFVLDVLKAAYSWRRSPVYDGDEEVINGIEPGDC